MEKSLRISGRILIYIGLYMATQILLSLLFGIIYGLQFAIKNHGKINPIDIQAKMQVMLNQHILYILIGSILVSLLLYSLIFKAKKESLFRTCNFSGIRISNIGLAVLLGAAFNWSLAMLDLVVPYYKLFPDHERIMATLMGGDFVLTLLIVGIVVPIFEEILFRGIILNELRKHISLMAAVVVQGLIFGIYHLNLLQGIYGAILGILAALAYIWLNSLWAPIFVHVSFNTLSVIMSRVGEEQIIYKYGVEMLIVSALVFVGSILLLWKNRIPVTDLAGNSMSLGGNNPT